MATRHLLPVRDSAGEKSLIAIRNIVNVVEFEGAIRLVEIRAREPINGPDGRIVGYEINLYYSDLNLKQFEGTYA